MPSKPPKDEFLDMMHYVTPIKQTKAAFDEDQHAKKTVQEIHLNEESQREQIKDVAPPVIPPKFKGATPQRPKRKKIKVNRNFQPDWTVDLHGQTRDEAMDTAEHCIYRAISSGTKSLLLITGKGLNSGSTGGVLQDAIWYYLKQLQENRIERFQWAPNHLGGEGAILVIFY